MSLGILRSRTKTPDVFTSLWWTPAPILGRHAIPLPSLYTPSGPTLRYTPCGYISPLSIQLMKMNLRDRHCLRHRGHGAMGARMRHFSHLSLAQVNIYITIALTGPEEGGQTSIPPSVVTPSFPYLPHPSFPYLFLPYLTHSCREDRDPPVTPTDRQ